MRISDSSSDVCSSDLPGADQIPTRNAKAHNAAPLSERNVVPRMGDRQQQPARYRRVLPDDHNRSFGPTGPPCATAHRYGGRGTTGTHAPAWHRSASRPPKDRRKPTTSEEQRGRKERIRTV